MASVFNQLVIDEIVKMLVGKDEVYLSDPVLQGKIQLAERSELAKMGYVIKHDSKTRLPNYIYRKDSLDALKTSPTVKAEPIKKAKKQIEYIRPHFTEELKVLFRCGKEWENNRSVNIRFVGPKGCGKSEFAYVIVNECGFSSLERINGFSEICSADFLGEKTVIIDKVTSNSVVKYQKGTLELAMTKGLKKDENGDCILDKDGNVIIEGAPALLFVDEYAAIPPHLSIILNRVLEIPPAGKSRGIEVASDMNRKVKAHPGFAMILAGNTNGKGCENAKTAGYTAQDHQQDDSTLDRITATYEFGYNLEAERMYIEDAIDDDVQVSQFIKFVEDIRKAKIDENVLTLLSTRGIVAICQLAKAFKDAGMKNSLVIALYRSVFSGLLEVEKDAWAEKLNIYFNYDVRQLGRKDKSMFYV